MKKLVYNIELIFIFYITKLFYKLNKIHILLLSVILKLTNIDRTNIIYL